MDGAARCHPHRWAEQLSPTCASCWAPRWERGFSRHDIPTPMVGISYGSKYAPIIFFGQQIQHPAWSRSTTPAGWWCWKGIKIEVCWRYPSEHSLLYYTNFRIHRGAWGLRQWCSEDSASSSSGRPFDSFLHQFAVGVAWVEHFQTMVQWCRQPHVAP